MNSISDTATQYFTQSDSKLYLITPEIPNKYYTINAFPSSAISLTICIYCILLGPPKSKEAANQTKHKLWPRLRSDRQDLTPLCLLQNSDTHWQGKKREIQGQAWPPLGIRGPCGVCSGSFSCVLRVIFSSIFVLFFSKMLTGFPLSYVKSGRKKSLKNLPGWQSGN